MATSTGRWATTNSALRSWATPPMIAPAIRLRCLARTMDQVGFPTVPNPIPLLLRAVRRSMPACSAWIGRLLRDGRRSADQLSHQRRRANRGFRHCRIRVIAAKASSGSSTSVRTLMFRLLRSTARIARGSARAMATRLIFRPRHAPMPIQLVSATIFQERRPCLRVRATQPGMACSLNRTTWSARK